MIVDFEGERWKTIPTPHPQDRWMHLLNNIRKKTFDIHVIFRHRFHFSSIQNYIQSQMGTSKVYLSYDIISFHYILNINLFSLVHQIADLISAFLTYKAACCILNRLVSKNQMINKFRFLWNSTINKRKTNRLITNIIKSYGYHKKM